MLDDGKFDLIVDAIFGYSFKGTEIREPFATIISSINSASIDVVSIDVPSGWDIENGNENGIGVENPSMLISLTLPKPCAKSFEGIHYLGGRFLPPSMQKKYNIVLPYGKTDLVYKLE
eukprot:TRINITY_DN2022_c0_g1_i1.p1 TRINITY_DN2022_c0_g1~~TRINITY_DN2022_c0_g1_i1.p1  ORF type:complete len:118 (-),score=23.93 TRINITY_DN2022_c0_g1_i1:241-594(-)